MAEPVRWGVLGCASIAVNKVIPGMRQAANCEIAGIASRNLERADEVAAQLGIARTYGSYQALLDDPEIEAVYIPLPNNLHAEWTLKAAAAGKHVLCEKPLAMTAHEAQTMVAGCREAGVLLMEAFMYRHHPLWVRARELVAEGRIGELTAVEAIFSYHNTDPANIRNIPELGGGALMDIGCYPVNVARMMFDAEPTAVQAMVRRDPVFGTDVLTSALLDFNGRHATFICSTQLERDQRVHLLGTEGRLLVEIPFNIPPRMPTRIIHTAGGNPPEAPETEVIEIPAADQYGIQGELFASAIRNGWPVPTPPGDAVANMKVIERIFAAAEASDAAVTRS
ncbi:Gfo/Idh/MocA family oxidoreductase [Phytoactinopolyspora alkaliphila]|uniref:Gfo/Idh/MocA family oxidoreductase n=1 Tax=Phytoactinopolyspora alkaliphila TaxID=1783498 RepID=A0A6N9YI95_9ACTN|nr:Gfo/Idh/MocA family oxidoreductase [Phytoactinopolyspora alkaliphila]NED94726.1 Gfo/Idh/MocA family oxidoreductase [Phytoactinopolyspora alkaliphila]